MATKYLYIDDDKMAHGIVQNIENNDLKFEVITPTNWNEQIELLIDEKKLNDYDGLLLDLKLEFSNKSDENEIEDTALPDSGEEVDKSKLIKFSGADLAQRIRTEVKSNKEITDLPIFLCSTDKVFMSFYDRTSYDLFDKKFNKNLDFKSSHLTTDTFVKYAEAYKNLSKSQKIQDYLKKTFSEHDEDLNILELELLKCDTPHEKIYLLDRFFIQKSGILADEGLVAIRLGIDIVKSTDWIKFLKTELNAFKYEGILGNLYPRWWIQDLISFFKSKYGINLKILNSKERVKLIKKIYPDYNLAPLDLLENHEFSTYWYKCILSGLPLDIIDGLKIIEIPRYPWIEQNFISKNYMLSDERDKQAILSLLGPNEKLIFNDLD